MIVVRFKVTGKPDKSAQLRAALAEVIAPSRTVDGVLSFDIAQDLDDPHTFIATEVFTDRAALERQESLAEVQHVMAIMPDALAAPPEATVYEVASAQPWGE